MAASKPIVQWLSPHDLLLVNDNDFGTEGAETEFWLVTFEEAVLG